MGEVVKPDALLDQFGRHDDSIGRLAAVNRRRLMCDATGQGSSANTASTSYVDLGPTVENVRPGPGGRLLVGLTVNADWVPTGEGLFVSYRTFAGPTVVASSDNRAWKLLNDSGGAISGASTFWTQTPILADGLYDLVMTMRSYVGGTVGVSGRELIITTSTAMPAS